MQSEVLEKNKPARVRVYVVWFNMLSGDSRQGWDPTVIHDPRAVHLWDQNRAVGRWFGSVVERRASITWDAYYLYGPDARWDAKPEPVVSSGSTIIGHAGKLKSDFARVTAGD